MRQRQHTRTPRATADVEPSEPQKSRSERHKAKLWRPGGRKRRIRLDDGRVAAADQLSPYARAMLDKSAVPDAEWPNE